MRQLPHTNIKTINKIGRMNQKYLFLINYIKVGLKVMRKLTPIKSPINTLQTIIYYNSNHAQ